MEFCPGCGKKSKGICKDCRPPREIRMKDIVVTICEDKNKVFFNNKWVSFKTIEQAVAKIAKAAIKETDTFEIIPKLPEFERNAGVFTELAIELKFEEASYFVPARLEVTYCDDKTKRQGNYFEGALQLRYVNDDIIKFVRSFIRNNGIFVASETKQKNGLDMQFSDQKKLQQLGKQLVKAFGGKVTASPRIYTRDKQTSKEVHRVNVLYEAPDYKAGQVMSVDNKVVLISKVGKDVVGTNLKTGKKITVHIKDKEYTVLEPVKTRVSRVQPHIEVLDPETFQSVAVQNTKKVKHDEKVKVVNDNGLYYIF